MENEKQIQNNIVYRLAERLKEFMLENQKKKFANNKTKIYNIYG